MGILSCLEPHPRLAAPDTPPELVSPTSSSYSSRPSPRADQTWSSAAAPISPPMSSYGHKSSFDMSSAGKSMEDGQRRNEPQYHQQSQPRPQMHPSQLQEQQKPSQQQQQHQQHHHQQQQQHQQQRQPQELQQPPALSRQQGAPQAPARTQLPPISSLLPSASIRPPLAHSTSSGSLSELRMPLPPASSLDRPSVTSAPVERSHAAHYYSHTSSPPITQPRSTYEPRYDDRQQHQQQQPAHHHALSRSHSGHGSPGPSGSVASNKWSTPTYPEYSLGGGRDGPPPPLPSPQDRPSMYPGPPTREHGYHHRDPRPSLHGGPSAVSNQPPTPTSAISEGVPTKDGLGPKIWTGANFLPRYVRTAEVPGEGLCYFYDDGTHCKINIDGEPVNMHWGVTKAGKPRKRLAIACITCREKKIKCDPDYPRCVQCEKFGRQCKFKNAPRGGHNTSPSTPPAEPEDHHRRAIPPPLKPSELHHRPGSNSSTSESPRTTLRMSSPEPPMHHAKRVRIGYDTYSPIHAAEARPMTHHAPELPPPASKPWPQQGMELPRIHEDAMNQRWHRNDPYVPPRI